MERDRADLRTFVTFETDFPDDAELSQMGDIIRPSGSELARALSDKLRTSSFFVSNPEQHSFYGWAFEVRDKHLRIWLLLQFVGPWLLLTENKTPLLRRVFSRESHKQHRLVLETLNRLLAQNPRFRKIEWFTEQQFANAKHRSSTKTS